MTDFHEQHQLMEIAEARGRKMERDACELIALRVRDEYPYRMDAWIAADEVADLIKARND